MRILLWHGYLLRGSGSNVHTANLARTWGRQGHEVLLLCQERDPAALEWVDSHGDFPRGNRSFDLFGGPVRVARPDIEGLLPVYVYDDYEGFTVKRFVDLTDVELSNYTAMNVSALVTAERAFRPDVVVVGHEVMGPYIALQAKQETGIPYTVKLHGSALEYAVKEQERYADFAREGLQGAAHVIGGSRYMLEAALEVVGGWSERGHVVNPGCDVDIFRPAPEKASGSRIGFVGKLIAAKGVHHLLLALGFTTVAGATCTVVGYGGDEEVLRELAAALREGDAARIEAVSAGFPGRAEWMPELSKSYLQRASQVEVTFTGRLEHDELAPFLPQMDLLVVPSVVPEAFGMVAAEAAACGVLPLVPRHSGIGEAGAAVEGAIGWPGELTFDPDGPVEGIARGIDRILGRPEPERADAAAAAVALARDRWSWERVAADFLAIASSR